MGGVGWWIGCYRWPCSWLQVDELVRNLSVPCGSVLTLSGMNATGAPDMYGCQAGGSIDFAVPGLCCAVVLEVDPPGVTEPGFSVEQLLGEVNRIEGLCSTSSPAGEAVEAASGTVNSTMGSSTLLYSGPAKVNEYGACFRTHVSSMPCCWCSCLLDA